MTAPRIAAPRFAFGCRILASLGFVALTAVAPALAGPIDLTVMTRNVYFGTVLEPVIAAPDPATLVAEVAKAFGAVVASKPLERMERIADEIAAARPHVVGLQEAVLWRSGPRGILATDVAFDFAGSLLAGLAARGQSYAAVAVSAGLDAQAPGLFPTGIPGVVPPGLVDIRFSDREVILVRTDLPLTEFRVLGAGSGTFAARYPIPIAGAPLESLSTYAYVDVEMSGARFRALSTHLDPLVAPVQEAQTAELVAVADASPYRQILLGDFNSPADGSGTDSYSQVLAAGFTDSWTEKGAGDGFTSHQAPDLLNPVSLLDERIDFVFHRGGFRTLSADVVGEDLADRTASGLWASDHAGVLATLRLLPVPGSALLLLIGCAAMCVVRLRH